MLLARGSIEGSCTAQVAAVDAVPQALVQEWAALAERASEPNAFAEPWFVVPALKQLRDGRTVRIVEARDGDGQLIGVIPLTLSRRYGRIPVSHTTNWAHFQCLMGTPLVLAGRETAFWKALFDLVDRSAWARGFVTLTGLNENGPLHRALTEVGRPCPIVHRYERAALESTLDGDAYLETHIRPKKRKELRRLANRLADAGSVHYAVLGDAAALPVWCDEFLRLEASGWKGTRGSAFGNQASTEIFFRDIMRGALEAGRLDFQRLDLDGRAIAMLINFRTPPGSWSFKTSYDEAFARYSPGVMIELEKLKRVLADPDIEWMDSCAVENHSMIDRIWAERRAIVQVTVPLAGVKRRAIYGLCRSAERLSALARRVRG